MNLDTTNGVYIGVIAIFTGPLSTNKDCWYNWPTAFIVMSLKHEKGQELKLLAAPEMSRI